MGSFNEKITNQRDTKRQEPPPIQHEMGDISKRSIRRFDVSATTELNDGIHWRSSSEFRVEIEMAMKSGNVSLAKKLGSKIDLHDREMRLSDHAALFAKLHFFPS
jgi:hypothetical protein